MLAHLELEHRVANGCDTRLHFGAELAVLCRKLANQLCILSLPLLVRSGLVEIGQHLVRQVALRELHYAVLLRVGCANNGTKNEKQ